MFFLSTGPTGGRSKVVKEEQTDLHIEAPPSAAKPGAKPHARREVLVRQIIETTSIELLNRPSEWSAPCWKAACCEVSSSCHNALTAVWTLCTMHHIDGHMLCYLAYTVHCSC